MQLHNSQFTTLRGNSQFAISHWLLALGLLLAGVGGAFLPWIWYESVALQLTGPGLAEFVKFLPAVRTGQVQIERLYFLWPLFVAMLALPLFAVNQTLRLPAWLRRLLRALVVPLALTGLSPVWTPAILMTPEFRLQTGLAGLAVGLAVVAPLGQRIPLRWLAALLLAGGLAALILPVWQFNLIQPGLAEAYHDPAALGWGWQLTAGGILLSLVTAVWAGLQGGQKTGRPES
ncbi:MAG: hypothetical protein AB1801_06915 [Chloroflexota bacterium]